MLLPVNSQSTRFNATDIFTIPFAYLYANMIKIASAL